MVSITLIIYLTGGLILSVDPHHGGFFNHISQLNFCTARNPLLILQLYYFGSHMAVSPYEKLCIHILGGLPRNVRGRPDKALRTTSELAKLLGFSPGTIYRWPLVDGNQIRIIPAPRANLIERLSNGAVTAEEIRDFARQHQKMSDCPFPRKSNACQ